MSDDEVVGVSKAVADYKEIDCFVGFEFADCPPYGVVDVSLTVDEPFELRGVIFADGSRKVVESLARGAIFLITDVTASTLANLRLAPTMCVLEKGEKLTLRVRSTLEEPCVVQAAAVGHYIQPVSQSADQLVGRQADEPTNRPTDAPSAERRDG